MQPLPGKLAFNGSTFDLYQKGRRVVAVEYRADENRYSFYIGKDIDDLCRRTAKDLLRRRLVENVADVQIVG